MIDDFQFIVTFFQTYGAGGAAAAKGHASTASATTMAMVRWLVMRSLILTPLRPCSARPRNALSCRL